MGRSTVVVQSAATLAVTHMDNIFQRNFLEVVEKFHEIKAIPMKIQIPSDISSKERIEKAMCHKSCYSKFSLSKLHGELKPSERAIIKGKMSA